MQGIAPHLHALVRPRAVAMPQAVPQVGLPRVLRRSLPRWQVWPHCHRLVSRESAVRAFLAAADLEQHFDNFKALGVEKQLKPLPLMTCVQFLWLLGQGGRDRSNAIPLLWDCNNTVLHAGKS